jgi:ketosteroid isomerase-like protein
MAQTTTRASLLLGLSLILASGGAPGGVRAQERAADLREEVADTERAFAQTMADRDHAAFTSFLSEEAVFFGDAGVLRGKGAVAEGWRPLFEGPDAPFSWVPEAVEVLASGTLAFSSGPVFNPQGERVGTFNSVWRLHEDGKWRIVFDKGCPPCLASPGE